MAIDKNINKYKKVQISVNEVVHEVRSKVMKRYKEARLQGRGKGYSKTAKSQQRMAKDLKMVKRIMNMQQRLQCKMKRSRIDRKNILFKLFDRNQSGVIEDTNIEV